jgi:hypothetical protein
LTCGVTNQPELADGLRRRRLRQHFRPATLLSHPPALRRLYFRLWIQQEGIVAAPVDAAQNHTKSNYLRNPPASEIFNEEVCNLLKRKIN